MATSAAAAKVEVTSEFRVGGRYELLGQIGSGGMGAVFRARDVARDRVVALKQLKVEVGHRNASLLKALFEREFHTLSRLKHPRIIEVYDYAVSDVGPYYTMELLPGKDLHVLAPLPYREACRLLRDVASSLALIHAHRLVHRDVSPRNVRLTADGRAKLIDFGALAGFGAGQEIIGTPSCIAPETLHRLPLDQRTDLFALGAVAYWALTARAAFPARGLQELPTVWRHTPAPPSSVQADIPSALDALVLSMLKIDPLARPASAAQVIDELTSIAELEAAEDDAQVAESYLQSSRMVGREREREWLKGRMLRALDGKGTEVVIDGPSGIGKTRLLRELGVVAQLEAIVALHADGQAGHAAYGLANALGVQLLDVAPEIARAAAGSYAPQLGHLSPELRSKLEVHELAPLPDDPNERRARFQDALHEWFTAVGRKLPLLVAVDNVHAADEASAAFLAALGRETRNSRMIVAVTQRTGETVVAAASLRALRKRSGHLKLAGLTTAACEELVKSLFGDVANTGRMAKLLHERSAGNPGQCMELARLLVRKQIARYHGGTWLLPFEVAADELPSGMAEVLAARCSALSAPARALAEALCIHAKPVSLERCLALVADLSQEQTHAALDELVAEQIVSVEQGYYRFEQTALRDALLSQMGEDGRRALHRQAGRSLLSSGNTPEIRVEAAWHLLHAGDETEGADLLAQAGRDYFRKQIGQETLEQIVRALEAAVDVYERQGRSEYEIAGLMFMVVPAAFFIDRRVTLKYGERAVQLGLKITGLGLAKKLSRFLGKKLGLIVALIVAGVRFSGQRRRGLNYGLREAIAELCTIVPSTVGTFNICYEIGAVKRLVELLEPLRLFGEGHIATLMHDYALGMLGMGQGREAETCEHMVRHREQFSSPKVIEVLGQASWSAMYGSIVFSLGILNAYEWGARALERATAMEALAVRLWTMAADQLRMLHHALRGETEEVQRYRERVELYAVQGSTTWQAELFWPVLLFGAEALTKDALSMRRIWEQLARRIKDVPGLEAYANAAQAAYLAMRGEHAEAIALYERILPQLPVNGRVAWSTIRAHAAEAMSAAGQHARAKELLLEVLSHAKPADFAMVGRFLEPQRQLALVEARLGHPDDAARTLDELLARHCAEDQPLLVGLLHAARAEVALLQRDVPTFDARASDVERCFRATKNPALIAQWERLLQRAVQCGLKRPQEAAVSSQTYDVSTSLATQQRVTSELWGAHEPYDYALRTIVQESRASAGFFYVYQHRRMHLAAATTTDEPLREFERELLERAQRIEFEAAKEDADDSNTVAAPAGLEPLAADHGGGDDEPETQFVASEPPDGVSSPFRLFVLSARDNERPVVIGGVALRAPESSMLRIDVAVLASLAQVLYERQGSTLNTG